MHAKAANAAEDGASPVITGQAAMVVYASSVIAGVLGNSPSFHSKNGWSKQKGNGTPNPGSTPFTPQVLRSRSASTADDGASTVVTGRANSEELHLKYDGGDSG